MYNTILDVVFEAVLSRSNDYNLNTKQLNVARLTKLATFSSDDFSGQCISMRRIFNFSGDFS